MVNHTSIQLAARARALTLSVCTTGAITMSASVAGGVGGASAFIRSTGSFITTDQLAIGMEVSAAGFPTSGNNGTAVVTALSDLICTVDKALAADAAGAGRTLSVGLPSSRVWENVKLPPTDGVPYVFEQYMPGPMSLATIGPLGRLHAEPMYSLSVFVPSGTGPDAASKYADAIIALYPSSLELVLPNGDALKVRGDVAPFRGQLIQVDAGWAVVPVTIPFRLYSLNSI